MPQAQQPPRWRSGGRISPTPAWWVTLTERVYRRGGWTDEDYSKLLLGGRSRIEDTIVLAATVAGQL